MGSSSADRTLQVPAFSPTHRVIAVDLRAHGQSNNPTGSFTIEQMADDVAGLLTQLGQPPAHVVALSLGGCVALALAQRHSARVRSLTLVNTFAKYQPAGSRGLARQLQRLYLLSFGSMPQVAAFVARGLFPKPEQAPHRQAAIASLSQNPRRTYFAAMRALLRFNVLDQLPTLQHPALVVTGDRDTTVALSAKETLHRGLPHSRLLVIPDSSHATPYDQFEIFNQAVMEFIAVN